MSASTPPGIGNFPARPKPPSNEQRYFDALKRITKYMSVEKLHRSADNVGLGEHEHVEMAYENVIGEAQRALGRRKRPKE